MPQVLKDLFNSKKFVVMLLVTVGLSTAVFIGFVPKETAVYVLSGIWASYLVSQGIADIGAKPAEAAYAADVDAAEARQKNVQTVLDLLPQVVPFLSNATQNLVDTFTSKGNAHDHAALLSLRDAAKSIGKEQIGFLAVKHPELNHLLSALMCVHNGIEEKAKAAADSQLGAEIGASVGAGVPIDPTKFSTADVALNNKAVEDAKKH